MSDNKFDYCIEDRVAGASWTIRRQIVNVPSGQLITEAWFTVKKDINDADSSAIVQKYITVTNVAGTGQIEDQGSSGTGIVRFDLLHTDTVLFDENIVYEYDIKVKTDAGVRDHPEIGTLKVRARVTRDD